MVRSVHLDSLGLYLYYQILLSKCSSLLRQQCDIAATAHMKHNAERYQGISNLHMRLFCCCEINFHCLDSLVSRREDVAMMIV